MNVFSDVLSGIAERNSGAPGDYIADDGFLMCGKCHTRKQCAVEWMGEGLRKMPVMCECENAAYNQRQEEQRRRDFEYKVKQLRRDGLTDSEYFTWTFEKDDRREPEISDACRKYVDEWGNMRADNVGLLFFGGVGTGKTFYACCIANALLEKCVPTLVTNFPRILNRIQSAGWGDERKDFYDRLQRYELVVIDDLGAERSTDYAMEQIYTVIDTRYRSGKPLIVTTNLSPSEIKNPGNIGYERIYDRIMQNALPVKMIGASRRIEIAAQKREKYQGLLGLKRRIDE